MWLNGLPVPAHLVRQSMGTGEPASLAASGVMQVERPVDASTGRLDAACRRGSWREAIVHPDGMGTASGSGPPRSSRGSSLGTSARRREAQIGPGLADWPTSDGPTAVTAGRPGTCGPAGDRTMPGYFTTSNAWTSTRCPCRWSRRSRRSGSERSPPSALERRQVPLGCATQASSWVLANGRRWAMAGLSAAPGPRARPAEALATDLASEVARSPRTRRPGPPRVPQRPP